MFVLAWPSANLQDQDEGGVSPSDRSTEEFTWTEEEETAVRRKLDRVIVPLTTFLYLRLGARERWTVSVTLSLGGFLFVYGLFARLLGVPFPPGRVFDWLGYG